MRDMSIKKLIKDNKSNIDFQRQKDLWIVDVMREEVASNIRFNIDIKEAKYTGKSVYSSDKNKVKRKRLKYAQGDET